jgi:UDP-glucose 4-epimerase
MHPASFLDLAKSNPRFHWHRKDLTDPAALKGILTSEVDWVFHWAANADVRDGLKHPYKDIEQNIQVTMNILEAMRKEGVRRIAFASTGSVYGMTPVTPTPENAPFPLQTSLYGTSKLAAEGLISSYTEGFGFQGLIFRFVSILGERYSHGHVIDFVRALKKDPKTLRILGDGHQKKSYLYVADCVEAISKALAHPWKDRTEIINLGTNEYVDVNQSVDVICETLGVKPERAYSGGDRGWPGDNPFIFLDTQKIRSIGWIPHVTIRDAVRKTVRYLLDHPELLKERKSP